MAANIGEGRIVTFCPACRQADDHPKHVLTTDPEGIGLHMDCCRDRGCPSGACDVILDGATPGPGKPMLAHVQKLHRNPEQVARKFEAHRDKNPALRTFTVEGAVPTQLTPADPEAGR